MVLPRLPYLSIWQSPITITLQNSLPVLVQNCSVWLIIIFRVEIDFPNHFALNMSKTFLFYILKQASAFLDTFISILFPASFGVLHTLPTIATNIIEESILCDPYVPIFWHRHHYSDTKWYRYQSCRYGCPIPLTRKWNDSVVPDYYLNLKHKLQETNSNIYVLYYSLLRNFTRN